MFCKSKRNCVLSLICARACVDGGVWVCVKWGGVCVSNLCFETKLYKDFCFCILETNRMPNYFSVFIGAIWKHRRRGSRRTDFC